MSRHVGTIVWHGLGESATGTPFLRVDLNVDGVGSKTTYVYLSEKALGMAKDRLRVCGFDFDHRDLGELEIDHELLAGNQVTVEIKQETYQNKPRERVEIVTDSRPVSAAKLAHVQSLLRGEGADDEDHIPF